MDFVITFFRDILDGPIYIIVAIISGILICSCIGYLAEVSINKKKAKEQYDNEHYQETANSHDNSAVSMKTKTIVPNATNPINNIGGQVVSTNVDVSVNEIQNNNSVAPQQPSNAMSQPQQSSPIPEMQSTQVLSGVQNIPSAPINTPNIDINSMQNINK